MPARRILSLWFPRLGAERLLRQGAVPGGAPFAVVREAGQMQVIASLGPLAAAAGLRVGQPLRDAMAMCPALLTRLQNPQAEAAFLAALRRWAGRFSPWVAEEPPDALVLDVTGCAHLFGGEAEMLARLQEDCAGFGLTVRCGLADTRGAAWALARHAGRGAGAARDGGDRTGDAIEQEARATRSRAARRAAGAGRGAETGGARIAPPGQSRTALEPLPVSALRLDPDTLHQLHRLGLRRIGDLAGQPRAGLARRFGTGLVLRLDQALGAAPEPVSPAPPEPRFATRLTLPEPIGLQADMLAALDRLLPRLCDTLRSAGRGARRLRLEALRADHGMQAVVLELARAHADVDRIRPLMAMKMEEIEAGFGIDVLRLEAVRTEPLHPRHHAGHLDASRAAQNGLRGAHAQDNAALHDLVTRLGARLGLETITRRHPADSHIPEKAALVLGAAWSGEGPPWPRPRSPRPLLLWPPEPVLAPECPDPPARFRWRGRELALHAAAGPERIAPEWWLDDPQWRSGPRDYWRVTCTAGDRLWLFYAHGGALSPGWFCHGAFA